MTTPADPRLAPCLVGTSRHTWRGPDVAPEPLEMWEQTARAAVADAKGSVDLLARVDHLGVVHCQSWAYDEPSLRLAERLGLPDVHREESILAGTSPQRLLDAAAERMLRGEIRAALVVGGEALHTRRVTARAGEVPDWSHPHPTPPGLPVDLEQWYLPTERAHGILPAWLTFALLEQARWAALGADHHDRRQLHRVMDRLNAVAADNPDAWFRERRSTRDLVEPSADNRMVTTPYTKRMTAFPDVDMAAANFLVTREAADAWGIPDDRRMYLRGWGFARDSVHVTARRDLAGSGAMRVATSDALAMSGLTLDDVDTFDLYSCFGAAVQFATDALGLDPEDPRPISVTGGLPYHGGPSSNYMGHSISHLVDRVRSGTTQVGMVTGVGMHMTKHVAAVWSADPEPVARRDAPSPEQRADGPALEPDMAVTDHPDGPAVALAATVVHRADGSPGHVVGIFETADGSRCCATSEHPDDVELVAGDEWVGRKAQLSPRGDGTNTLRW
jgi:acetyl-CoA C-acetyltransferase